MNQRVAAVDAFRTRFPWLLCNLGGGLLAAFLSGLYDDVVRVVAVALFIPVVLAMAESVDIQSVSLALEALAGAAPTWRAVLPRLRRELLTGGMIGLAAGLLVAAVALVWLRHGRVALPVRRHRRRGGGRGRGRAGGADGATAAEARPAGGGRPDRPGDRRHAHAAPVLQPGPWAGDAVTG